MKDANLADRKVVSYILHRFGIHLKHKLGQNFLIRPDVVASIAEAAEAGPNVPILEIGAGIGTLTQGLAETGAPVTAFELDKGLEKVLSHTLEKYPNVHIIYEDILKADLKNILGNQDWHCAANLPYYITTPILLTLIQSDLPISVFVFMMQKEVADRIEAAPGSKDYGALSIAIQYYCTVERVLDIPPSAFIPRPAVYSTVLKIRRRESPAVKVSDEKLFFRLVKAGFGQRRKIFSNALKSMGLSKEDSEALLSAAGIDGQRRGETFSMQEYADLANAWADMKSKDQ
jgi:16S rRNA (adenine1518-N6/adenine1519-N6)-dimethyltransferase